MENQPAPSSPAPEKLGSTNATLLALAAGLLIGSAIKLDWVPFLDFLPPVFDPIGALWTRALQMVAVPLVISRLLIAICSQQTLRVGRLIGSALALYLVLMLAFTAFTIASTRVLLEWITPSESTLSALRNSPLAAQAPTVGRAMGEDGLSFSDWVIGLVPTNLLGAAVDGNLIQLVLVTILFGIAITRLRPESHRQLSRLVEDFGDVLMVMVHWILRVTPLAVFALALSFSSVAGVELAGLLGQYVVLLSGLLLVATLLLYPTAILGGGIRVEQFARAVYQGQIVALTTRSSMAAIPALMEGAYEHLPTPRRLIDFSLPFSASIFKISRAVSNLVQPLFLTHIYGVSLGWTEILAWVAINCLLSLATLGVPGGAQGTLSLPFYLAMGIPIEGIVLVRAVDAIPDIFKTLHNATGFAAATVLLARLPGTLKSAEPETEQSKP